MNIARRLIKFFKDELVFVIGSFILTAIPTVLVVAAFMSFVSTARSGIESARGYMASMVGSSFETEYSNDADDDEALNVPQMGGDNEMVNAAREFAGVGTGSKENPLRESFRPYVTALAVWFVILSLRFIWWVKPKKSHYYRRDYF